jgi:hypothetical protein
VTGTPPPDRATPNRDAVTGDAQSVTPKPQSATPSDELRHEEVRRVAAKWGITPDELVNMLRDVVTEHHRDASRCDWCEGPMPETATRGSDRRYCSQNCRKEASRDRVARRRMFAERAAQGETHGTCDVCGAGCRIENALCDACVDDLNESADDATGDASAMREGGESDRG